MAPRKTQSGTAQAKEAEKNQPENLVEPDSAAEQRKQELKDAPKPPAAEKVDAPEQAYKSSHVPGSAGVKGHPGYFPDQYTDPRDEKKSQVNYGHFCVVTKGDEKGLYGVYIDNVASDDQGRPTRVIVRERNTGRQVAVNYDDLEPAEGGDVGRGR